VNFEAYAFELLEKLGIKTGHIVLDFGCGPGTYAIPAARIVGENGRVYALDKDKQALDDCMENARKADLRNMKRIDSSKNLEIDLEDESVDFVLLFDVFHSYYFPETHERRKLLGEFHRVLKPDGVLLVYPKHMETEAEDEIKHWNFHLQTAYSATLIHDRKDFVNGHVLIFRKDPNDNPKPVKFQRHEQDPIAAEPSFKGYSVVSCGTLSPELNHLRDNGFLDADKVLYTRPGLHENPREFENHLRRQLRHANRYSQKVVVVYGKRCYIDPLDPFKSVDKIIQQEGGKISRVKASNCIDMLADTGQRERIRGGQKLYWLSPGWLKYWRVIFKEWDVGLANETFPQNEKGVLLDALGFFDAYTEKFPEKILEFSDWMRIGIEPYRISLDRLKGLLLEAAEEIPRA
jgi:ubiquinone/menaquinone biosynthesis C-methylase UbiE